jgi:hypothetical protein
MAPLRHIKIELKKIKKKCEIMNVVCSKHAGYYKKLNNMATSILIVLSSFTTIINSIWESVNIQSKSIQLITIILNAFITVIITFQRVFKYESKANNYAKCAIVFHKMGHTVNQKLISGEYDINYLESQIVIYDNAVENISDGFKDFIISYLKKEFDDIDSEYLPAVFGKIRHSIATDNTLSHDNLKQMMGEDIGNVYNNKTRLTPKQLNDVFDGKEKEEISDDEDKTTKIA